MKALKTILLAAAACMALCLTSCTKETGGDLTVGTYTCTVDVAVSTSEGSGIVFSAMRDAVILATRGYNTRCTEGDNAAIAAADKEAAARKDQSDKPIVVSVVFQPGNAMGEAEKKPVVLKTYSFKPVD